MTIEEAMREQSERHHAAIGEITKVLAKVQERGDQTYQLLAGTFDRPGLVHRVQSMESWRAESPRRWLWERGTRVVDAVLVAVVLTLGALAIRAFILDAVRSGEFTMYQRDRVALNQERNP